MLYVAVVRYDSCWLDVEPIAVLAYTCLVLLSAWCQVSPSGRGQGRGIVHSHERVGPLKLKDDLNDLRGNLSECVLQATGGSAMSIVSCVPDCWEHDG